MIIAAIFINIFATALCGCVHYIKSSFPLVLLTNQFVPDTSGQTSSSGLNGNPQIFEDVNLQLNGSCSPDSALHRSSCAAFGNNLLAINNAVFQSSCTGTTRGGQEFIIMANNLERMISRALEILAAIPVMDTMKYG